MLKLSNLFLVSKEISWQSFSSFLENQIADCLSGITDWKLSFEERVELATKVLEMNTAVVMSGVNRFKGKLSLYYLLYVLNLAD